MLWKLRASGSAHMYLSLKKHPIRFRRQTENQGIRKSSSKWRRQLAFALDCPCRGSCYISIPLTARSTLSNSHQVSSYARLSFHQALRAVLDVIWCTNRAYCVRTVGTDALRCIVYNPTAKTVWSRTIDGLAWIRRFSWKSTTAQNTSFEGIESKQQSDFNVHK